MSEAAECIFHPRLNQFLRQRLMQLGLEGKAALVCGASKGLGRACAPLWTSFRVWRGMRLPLQYARRLYNRAEPANRRWRIPRYFLIRGAMPGSKSI